MRRHLPAIARALLLAGVTVGVIGQIGGLEDTMRAGILICVASAPPLIVGAIRRAQRVSDDQLAEAHRAGYELALAHVARGLLDQPTTPPDGHLDNLDELENVRRLRSRREQHPEQAAL